MVRGQTLTCQTSCPQPGQVFSIKTSSPVLNTPGMNQLWDFSQVEAVSPATQLVSYLDPGSVPSGSLYPQTDVVRLQNGLYTFLNTDSNGVRSAVSSSSSSNAETLELPLPFSYGNTYTQTTLSTVVNGTDTIINKDVRTFYAHGTGTLILPGGTYNDVLSIKGNSTKSSTKNGAPYGYIYDDHFNYYYSDKIAHPLLYTSQKSETGPMDYAPYTAFIWSVQTSVENQALSNSVPISLYPNPANTTVRIELPEFTAGKIILTNSLGTELMQVDAPSETSELDLTSYPEGIYLVSFSDNYHTFSRRLLISR
jgi:hypothetical protein